MLFPQGFQRIIQNQRHIIKQEKVFPKRHKSPKKQKIVKNRKKTMQVRQRTAHRKLLKTAVTTMTKETIRELGVHITDSRVRIKFLQMTKLLNMKKGLFLKEITAERITRIQTAANRLRRTERNAEVSMFRIPHRHRHPRLSTATR